MSLHSVLSVTHLTEGTCFIRFTREDIIFQAGQFLLLGLPGGDLREYSVFSRPHDDWLEILVRVIPDGVVSSQLAQLQSGDTIKVEGGQGSFVVPADYAQKKFLFVATGTGLAPFHSIVGTYPQLDYQLYHGVRYATECYARTAFFAERYHACISGEAAVDGAHTGRVTNHLRNQRVPEDTECYLCGSCDMIYEMFALLQAKGIPRMQIHTETYY